MNANLQKFLSILAAVGPAILGAAVPGAQVFIPVIIGAIGEAQAIKGATGPQKKAHVLAIVTSAVTLANATHQIPALDAPLVLSTVGSGIDTVIGTIHIIDGTKKAVDVAAVN